MVVGRRSLWRDAPRSLHSPATSVVPLQPPSALWNVTGVPVEIYHLEAAQAGLRRRALRLDQRHAHLARRGKHTGAKPSRILRGHGCGAAR